MRFRFSGILLSAWVHSPAIEGLVFWFSAPVSVYSIVYVVVVVPALLSFLGVCGSTTRQGSLCPTRESWTWDFSPGMK